MVVIVVSVPPAPTALSDSSEFLVEAGSSRETRFGSFFLSSEERFASDLGGTFWSGFGGRGGSFSR